MKKFMPWIIIGALVLICCFTACGAYNGIVEKSNLAEQKWADVESAYQRRSDLIPNIVNTVKGYATHEKSTLEEIVAERAKATQPQINFDEINDQTLAQYQKAQGEVSQALGRLMAISENYPDLKASQNFAALQDELSGTENRINVARRDFNDAIKQYNTTIQTFPRNIIAGMFGYSKKSPFAAEAGAEKA
ncbi:MAG: LemA family protein, partial [Mucinivorans sp.]